MLTGVVAATQAGPAVSLSFLIAGVASGAAALCYAEFASMLPVAGSAYTYAYAVLGELPAWIIGWDLLLEYALVVSVVSIGWSGYLRALLALFGIAPPDWAAGAPGTGEGHVVDLFAMLGACGVALLLTLRIEWGARFNTAMVLLKIAAVIVVIVAAAPHVDPANWRPFMPFGFGGVVEGAAVVFFAVFGYDTLTTAGEEALEPQRDLPRAVLLSLVISLTLYVVMSLALTGIVTLRHARQRRARGFRFRQARHGLGDARRLGGGGGRHFERDDRLPARLRAHLVRDEPRRAVARLVRAAASNIRDALSPDADRRRTLRPRLRLFSDQGSGRAREYRHTLGLRRDLPRRDRAAPHAPRHP